ncbi:hypothetical protein [Streptomyces griseus]|uniref:hypothetical protein n=1 Tax=Streptomyces griseus TaxID=1911 RepID=UPI00055F2154|nr:hypothetical protein [Streptomyces griseus]
MSIFLQQLPALLGVVIGALGSYLAVVRSDRARFRRERAAHWEERRLAVYGDYARAVKKSVVLMYRVASGLGRDPHPHPLTPEEAAPVMAAAADAVDSHWESLLLLGSARVVERARAWIVVLREMERFLNSGSRDGGTWEALLERQRAGREGYYGAVREDLALPHGPEALGPLPAADPV